MSKTQRNHGRKGEFICDHTHIDFEKSFCFDFLAIFCKQNDKL